MKKSEKNFIENYKNKTKFQQNWPTFKFCPMVGGPFTPPPIWGVSNAPMTLIIFPEVRPYPRIKLHNKTKNDKI